MDGRMTVEGKNGVTLLNNTQVYKPTRPGSRAVCRAEVIPNGEGVELGSEPEVFEYDHTPQQFLLVINLDTADGTPRYIRFNDLPAIARLGLGRVLGE